MIARLPSTLPATLLRSKPYWRVRLKTIYRNGTESVSDFKGAGWSREQAEHECHVEAWERGGDGDLIARVEVAERAVLLRER